MAKGIAIGYSDRDWQGESDLATLLEAARIRKDAKRMAAVKKCAKKKLDENNALEELAGKDGN